VKFPQAVCKVSC